MHIPGNHHQVSDLSHLGWNPQHLDFVENEEREVRGIPLPLGVLVRCADVSADGSASRNHSRDDGVVMNIELWKSKLHNAQVLNLLFASLAIVLAVALVANGFFRQNVAVHVVPINPTQEYWANAMGGDEYYKKSIAMAMLPWIANVTPASVDFHHRQLLQWVPSSHYGLMSESLGAEAVYVKNNNLSRVFFVTASRVDGDVAVFEGLERRFVGKSEIREEEREYRISMRWDQGRPWVVGLSAAHLDRSRQDSQADPAKG